MKNSFSEMADWKNRITTAAMMAFAIAVGVVTAPPDQHAQATKLSSANFRAAALATTTAAKPIGKPAVVRSPDAIASRQSQSQQAVVSASTTPAPAAKPVAVSQWATASAAPAPSFFMPDSADPFAEKPSMRAALLAEYSAENAPADFTDLKILKLGDARHPTEYQTSSKQVIEAIVQAAKIAGVSPQTAGSIAWLESIGGNPNAHNGSSRGLFEMQRATSNAVMKHHGKEIAAALTAAHNPKYATMIAVLSKGELPKDGAYNLLVQDPYYNALLGAFLIKMNATDQGLDPRNPADMYKIYVENLTGKTWQELDPGQQPLTSVLPAQDITSNPLLGNTTTVDAYDSLTRNLRIWGEKFAAAYQETGLPPLTVAHRNRFRSASAAHTRRHWSPAYHAHPHPVYVSYHVHHHTQAQFPHRHAWGHHTHWGHHHGEHQGTHYAGGYVHKPVTVTYTTPFNLG